MQWYQRRRWRHALANHNAELHRQVYDSHWQLAAAQRRLIQQERPRALGEMASGVAHDLNNALAPVLGFTELLVHQPDARANRRRRPQCTGEADYRAFRAEGARFFHRGTVGLRAHRPERDPTRRRPRHRAARAADEPALLFNAVDACPDGSLEIESAPGEGTTVSAHLLQYGARRCTAQTSNTGASVHLRALHVLVADDEPLLRTLFSEFLTALGHTADLAASGDEAWQRFHQGAYDLVIIDRAMPGMSGGRLAQRIMALRASTPVVLLTGFGDLLNASGQRPDGLDVVLGKPVTLAALRSGIANALGSGSQERAA